MGGESSHRAESSPAEAERGKTDTAQPLLTAVRTPIEAAWYAVYAQVRHEGKVHSRLLAKSFECLFPQMERWSRRRDRRKKIRVPIFPGYLFVHTCLDNQEHVRIRQTPGVVSLVRNKDGPLPVPESQINSLKILLGGKEFVTSYPYLRADMYVRVVNGPLRGCEGILIRKHARKSRLVVAIDIIQQAVSVELNEEEVEPVSA
jgi:transcription antitermination factor NusG